MRLGTYAKTCPAQIYYSQRLLLFIRDLFIYLSEIYLFIRDLSERFIRDLSERFIREIYQIDLSEIYYSQIYYSDLLFILFPQIYYSVSLSWNMRLGTYAKTCPAQIYYSQILLLIIRDLFIYLSEIYLFIRDFSERFIRYLSEIDR